MASEILLQVIAAGHNLAIDKSDRTGEPAYRVICNGAVVAMFFHNLDTIQAIIDTGIYLKRLELRCLENPKP